MCKMSKPNKPGELRNVDVQAISLVSKAANRQKFKIFKSASDNEIPQQLKLSAPEVIEKNERGLFHILKKFFTNEDIEKGEVADIVNTQDKGRKLGQAMDALFAVLGTNRWGEGDTKIETDAKKIRAALNDFKAVAENILIGSDEEVTKTVAELEKSGRKISGSRLTKLKDIQSLLNDFLNGLDENKEDKELTTEEITKAVQDALKPLDERIAKLENVNKEDITPEQSDVNVAEVVKSAVNEAIAPLKVRLEKVETARGFSNKVPEDTPLIKSDSEFWNGAF